ncbi:hypothetical protein O3P69_002664 [Scylla paramamosain]|uniref:Uncharacterized protein n=1 Tax=Scylla paramamosain TaxID=85552 RepID=A0AAW0ULV8_SCYPA
MNLGTAEPHDKALSRLLDLTWGQETVRGFANRAVLLASQTLPAGTSAQERQCRVATLALTNQPSHGLVAVAVREHSGCCGGTERLSTAGATRSSSAWKLSFGMSDI